MEVYAYLRVLTVWMMALSWLKVPSALVREERFSMGMRMPVLVVTGLADAMRARATVRRVALQNMMNDVGEKRGWRAESSRGCREQEEMSW